MQKSAVFFYLGGQILESMTRAELAPDISSHAKNQFNIKVPTWGTYLHIMSTVFYGLLVDGDDRSNCCCSV